MKYHVPLAEAYLTNYYFANSTLNQGRRRKKLSIWQKICPVFLPNFKCYCAGLPTVWWCCLLNSMPGFAVLWVFLKFIINEKRRLNIGQLNFTVKHVMWPSYVTAFKSRCGKNTFDSVVVIKRSDHHVLKTAEVQNFLSLLSMQTAYAFSLCFQIPS